MSSQAVVTAIHPAIFMLKPFLQEKYLHCKFMHVGNQFIHHSHRIHTYKGFVYCGKCGHKKGTNQMRILAKPCAPPAISGLRTLEAIQLGSLPPGMSEWPDEESDDSSDEALTLY